MTAKSELPRPSWENFVEMIVADVDRGVDDRQLSEIYGNQVVSWVGRVEEMHLEEEYAPGVALFMPKIQSQMLDGYTFIAEYLFVKVAEDTASTWSGVSVGDKVRFECFVSPGNPVFEGVQVFRYPDERECHLELALHDGKCIEKC